MMNLNYYLFLLIVLTFSCTSPDKHVELHSPNGESVIAIQTDTRIAHTVTFQGKPIIVDSPFSLKFSQAVAFEKNFIVDSVQVREVNEIWEPVYGKHSQIANHYNELILTLREKNFPGRTLKMEYRAYNDGIAFRYHIPESFPKPQEELTHELTMFRFEKNHTAWVADHQSFTSSQEREYFKKQLSDIEPGAHVGMPLLVKIDDNCFAAFTEANLLNWAGMYITGHTQSEDGANTLRSLLSPIPNAFREEGYDKPTVQLEFPVTSPWRVIMLAERAEKMIESEILMNLSEPNAIGDASWIRPGLVVWDGWWSRDEINTAILKEYIDFASYMGIPYQMVDWGWSKENNILEWNENVNLKELLEYAESKNVKLWLWSHYTDIDRQYKEAFPLYREWGIAGVKIDFMNRDDQEMVNWYHEIARVAAENKLMLNFHGSYKPTGDRRTYPNMMTREGVYGNENNKWSDRVTPDHNVTLAFTRNILGANDYTPGGFHNRAMGKFKSRVSPTQVMGTRCHQLAMYVVYDSPIAFLCDHPDSYYNQPGLEFLKVVPTTSDEILALNGEVGKYVTVARRVGNDWFIGSMNGSQPRELKVSLSFLAEGEYEATIFQDTEESNVDAEKLDIKNMPVKPGETITIRMASGGGYAAHLRKL